MPQKNILLGITGGIAAYKSAELTRLLCKNGMNVQVIMTKSGQKFVTPLLMGSLSGRPVHSELFENEFSRQIEHINLARWANAILIAPATANFIAKLAHGICDDLLSTLCLAKTESIPLIIAPAMNKEMWSAHVTQDNINLLEKRGVIIFGPADGEQACGEVGFGRMIEPTDIIARLKETLITPNILSSRKIIITAGPTREYLDPVRYISNNSSGKMGYALAAAAHDAGAKVTLITGPTHIAPPCNINLINVISGKEMSDAVMSQIKQCDVFISVAAVADYQPKATANQKIKKYKKDTVISLEPTIDILSKVASLPSSPFTVGFAAETENLMPNASNKLKQKKLDMIVANQVGPNVGFGTDNNHVFVMTKKSSKIVELSGHKSTIALELIKIIAKTLHNKKF